jgi:2',3'-cyclic-nucleotide 2'-phosphodiesterase (5'-nucleotidase family)
VLNQAVEALKQEQVDLIVGLTHVSAAEDKEILKKCPGIDLVLGGHDHDPMGITVNDKLLFKCGQNAYHVGVVDIRLGGGDSSVQAMDWMMVSTAQVEDDPACLNVIQAFLAQQESSDTALAASLDEAIVHLQAPLCTLTNSLRRQETSAGTLFADAMFAYYARAGGEPDLAILNGGFIRGDRVYAAETDLIRRNIKDELPFPRESVCIEIFGKDLMQGIEQELRFLPAPAGSFPHFSRGVEIRIDPSKEPLQRIVSMTLHGEPIQAERRYKLVTTEFIATGGDGCSSFAFGLPQTAVQPNIISDIVLMYLEQVKVVSPGNPGRCVFVESG